MSQMDLGKRYKRKFKCQACGYNVIAWGEAEGGWGIGCDCGESHVDKLTPDIWEELPSQAQDVQGRDDPN